MNPQNGIIGDNFGTELPETEVDKDELENEKNLAQYSKTTEFKRLKEHFEERIKFYQSFLPDGRPITSVQKEERESMWVAANCIIGEFKAVIMRYEQAADVVKDAQRKLS